MAESGFKHGYDCLMAELLTLGLIKKKSPSVKAYCKALDKIPETALLTFTKLTHEKEFSKRGELYHGMKIVIPDGTKIAMSASAYVIAEYDVGQGHYPQALGLGFFDLSTRTFSDFKLSHEKFGERYLAIEHMKENNEKSLYLADAGYNGMAFIALAGLTNHDVLMPLKLSKLSKSMKGTRIRSKIVEIVLTRSHLIKYPEHKSLAGSTIKVRLIRTRGTSKLSSQILITTLLDETQFTWQELSNLYRQRYLVELAFRHLKVQFNIEKIKKRKLSRIKKHLFAAVALYNLGASVRNQMKAPRLFPERTGTKVYCLKFCLEKTITFCLAAIKPFRGIQKQLTIIFQALKSCYFTYRPWRSEPRICNTPASPFMGHKGMKKNKAIEIAVFLRQEYLILNEFYDKLFVRKSP